MPVQTQLQQRRGTAASWTSTNPTLAAGEIGFESDTGKFKIGNGSTAWASLAYATNGAVVSPLTTKGDLFTYSTTNARLAVGNNGETIVADSSTVTGLRYQGNFAAGKNKIINGDFGIWQRGTSFTGASGFTSDRWSVAGGESGSVVSRQTFTPGTAPVAGYEGTYFLDFAKNGTTANSMFLEQKMEDVRLFAGQTITISFWMKGSTAFTNEPLFRQNFGSGGSSEIYTTTATNSVTTSWARYSVTVAVPSISGKTIGTSSFLGIWPIRYTGTSNITVSIWGVQVEAGSVATAFQTATGTLQGELAACQRYYVRLDAGTTNYNPITPIGGAVSTTSIALTLQPPVTMRTAPSSIEFASMSVYGGSSGGFGFLSVSSLALIRATGGMAELTATVSGATAGGFYRLQPNNAAGYVGVNAEL